MESMYFDHKQALQRSVLWCAVSTANVPRHLRPAAEKFILAGKLPASEVIPELVQFLRTGLKVSNGWEALRDISALAATLINQLDRAAAAAAADGPTLDLRQEWRRAA